MLALSVNTDDSLADQTVGRARACFHRAELKHVNTAQDAANKPIIKKLDEGLDFGRFGHAAILPHSRD